MSLCNNANITQSKHGSSYRYLYFTFAHCQILVVVNKHSLQRIRPRFLVWLDTKDNCKTTCVIYQINNQSSVIWSSWHTNPHTHTHTHPSSQRAFNQVLCFRNL